jgi:hypothetical protein
VFAATGRELFAFPGPSGVFFGDGPRLFSSDRDGLSRWDTATGERTALLPSIRPTHHHRAARELAYIDGDTLVRLLL